MDETDAARAAEPLLAFDRRARDLFKPYRKTAPIAALRWFGQSGDQLQLRLLCGGLLAFGLLRRDARMTLAACRMLASHELATLAKKAVKNRVDRVRPRSAAAGEDAAPRPGNSREKALNSFPSGHSAGAMAVGSAFAAHYPEHRVLGLGAAAAVCAVQVPTCSHYPSDVAVGAALGGLTDAAVGLAERIARGAWTRWRG